jgi:hypothetical protein
MPSAKRSQGWANWRLRQLGATFGGINPTRRSEVNFGKGDYCARMRALFGYYDR